MEAKAMLELIGKTRHSEGLREEDPSSSNPEAKERPLAATQHD